MPKLTLQDDCSLGVFSQALPWFPKAQDKAICFSYVELTVQKLEPESAAYMLQGILFHENFHLSMPPCLGQALPGLL